MVDAAHDYSGGSMLPASPQKGLCRDKTPAATMGGQYQNNTPMGRMGVNGKNVAGNAEARPMKGGATFNGLGDGLSNGQAQVKTVHGYAGGKQCRYCPADAGDENREGAKNWQCRDDTPMGGMGVNEKNGGWCWPAQRCQNRREMGRNEPK